MYGPETEKIGRNRSGRKTDPNPMPEKAERYENERNLYIYVCYFGPI